MTTTPRRKNKSTKAAGKKAGTSAMWGGRFDAAPSELMEEINVSTDFDVRLLVQDITASKAHAAMLARQGIISQEDGDAIAQGLDTIHKDVEAGHFTLKRSLEDVHMNVEARLGELIGEAAGRLHTARSRNDQVATDMRLWVRDTLDRMDGGLAAFQATLIDQAEAHADTIMPGFTHLQTAQPVTLGHHLLAYVEMLGRDRGRLSDCRRRLNESPLGSAALAGTAFPIDRHATAEALGFDRPTANSLDAVSDRDYAMEFLGAGAILSIHLSRLAEEIVLWCSDGFAFARLSDAFATGSSIMPQKRNPDAAELVRAKSGRVVGALNTLLMVMKGLPLAYAKDMQEDKEPVFDAADTLSLSIAVMAGMVADLSFDKDTMKIAAGRGHSSATDLADWLVRVLGMPFREAHGVTGALVKLADEKGCALADLSVKEMQAVNAGITEDVFTVLGVEASVNSRDSHGGTAPTNVRAAAAEARRRFLGVAP